MAEERHRCGTCVRFRTPKCTFAYSKEPIKPREPKVAKSMVEFQLYDFSLEPPQPMKVVSNFDIIEPTDFACADWEEK